MKKIGLLFWMLSFALSIHSQEIVFYPYKKDFIATEIIMNDGTMRHGYVKDFTLPKTVEFRGFGFEFNSIENKLNLDETEFKYRATPDGTTEALYLNDIQRMVLKGEDTLTYEKLKLKTINSKNEIIDLNRTVMMPVLREGNINLYGLTAYNCQNNGCERMFVIAYIRHKDQEHAYIPLDINRINFFNLGSLDDKFMTSFAEAGKDCPEFLMYLDDLKVQIKDKEFRKDAKSAYKAMQKEKKERLKTVKGLRNKQRISDEMEDAYFLSIYTNIIDAYDARCGS